MKTTMLFLLILFASLVAQAQASGNSLYGRENYESGRNRSTDFRNYRYAEPVYINDSVMEISVKTLMNVKADAYIAIIGATQSGETAEMCNQLINNRISGFLDSLKTTGIQTKDVVVDFISQIPNYSVEIEKKLFSKTYNEIPDGFTLSKNVHILYSNATQLDQIVFLATKFEMYDIIKIEYCVNNTEAIYDSLRHCAQRLLLRKVNDMKKMGLKPVIKYQTLAESTSSVYPYERYSSYTAFSAPRIFNKKVASSSSYNSQQKQTTFYYNRIPYNDFDIVINPVLLEPAVQFMYSLKMKISLKKNP